MKKGDMVWVNKRKDGDKVLSHFVCLYGIIRRQKKGRFAVEFDKGSIVWWDADELTLFEGAKA